MSELARNEHGDEWTAFALKDEYLRNGTEFRWFVCAYCDTPVKPAAIDKKKHKKAPYFIIKKHSRPHAKECPYGEATFAAYGIARKASAKHEFDVDLPERLVPIRSQRVDLATTNSPPKEFASPEEIRRRVRAGSEMASIANQYTTGILETLVDARNAAMKAIRNLPNVKEIEDKTKHWNEVYKRLEACPLSLYGRKLNYRSAFRKANQNLFKGPYIYYGVATVEAVPEGFFLILTDRIINPASSEELPVHIRVLCDARAPVNRMEARTIERLSAAARDSKAVRWYAYGELIPNESDSSFELTVRQPPHIFAYVSNE